MTLGKAIKLIRTARQITQRHLAGDLKVSANYLSLIEGDKRDPSLDFLRRLADKLGVPIAMLFMFQGHPIEGVREKDLDELRQMVLKLDRIAVRAKKP